MFGEANYDIANMEIEVGGRIIRLKDMNLGQYLELRFVDHRKIDAETLEKMNNEWLDLSYKLKFERYRDMMYEKVMMDYDKVVDELWNKFERLSDKYK